MDSIDKLARILRESKNAVFFGGAGAELVIRDAIGEVLSAAVDRI